MARVAAGAFGFLTLIYVFEGPERYGASSFFETMPSEPSLLRFYHAEQRRHHIGQSHNPESITRVGPNRLEVKEYRDQGQHYPGHKR